MLLERQIIFFIDSYYLDDAAREGVAAKNVKFIGAVNPQSRHLHVWCGRVSKCEE